MKKIYKSLTIAFCVTIGLHLLYFLFMHFLGQLNETEIKESKEILPLTLSLFFLPIFCSYLFYKIESKNHINILRSGIISIFIIGLLEIIFFTFFKNRPNFAYFDGVFFRAVFIGLFISLFFTLFQIISNKSKLKVKSTVDIKFSWKTILLIPTNGILIYALIILVASSSYNNIIIVVLRLFPFGILLSILSFFFFNKIYKLEENRKRRILIISFYIFSILIAISISIFTSLLEMMAYRSVNELIKNVVLVSLALYTPYYLFVVSVNHFYFLKQLNNQEKQILKQQSLASQLNYQQLKTQLSPHFLFNNINVLTSLIEENPKKAIHFSENLSHIYRYFLEQEKQDVVLLKDEIKFAKTYLELLKDRFENGLNFSISIDKISEEKYIVSTILQQVLENVVKHNEISLEHPVFIQIAVENDYLVVENNKNPRISSDIKSEKGIENIKQRILFFSDKKVIINNLDDKFSIKLPILEIEA